MMKLARRLALIVLAAAAAVALAGTSARSAPQAAKPKLTSFGTCGQLLGYAKGQAKRFVGPYGYGTLGTPDADGGDATRRPRRHTRSCSGRRLLRHERAGGGCRRAGPRQDGRERRSSPSRTGSCARWTSPVRSRGCSTRSRSSRRLSHELLLHGDRLLVLSRGGYWIEPLPAMAARIAPYQPSNSVLAEVDVSDPAKLRLVRTLTLDGSYVAARLVGSVARIVVSVPACRPRSRSSSPPTARPRRSPPPSARTRPSLARSKVATGSRPTGSSARRDARRRARPLVQCRHVRRPTAFSGLGMLTVLTVDLDEGPAARRLGRGR